MLSWTIGTSAFGKTCLNTDQVPWSNPQSWSCNMSRGCEKIYGAFSQPGFARCWIGDSIKDFGKSIEIMDRARGLHGCHGSRVNVPVGRDHQYGPWPWQRFAQAAPGVSVSAAQCLHRTAMPKENHRQPIVRRVGKLHGFCTPLVVQTFRLLPINSEMFSFRERTRTKFS